jgi:hypothetical protein
VRAEHNNGLQQIRNVRSVRQCARSKKQQIISIKSAIWRSQGESVVAPSCARGSHTYLVHRDPRFVTRLGANMPDNKKTMIREAKLTEIVSHDTRNW